MRGMRVLSKNVDFPVRQSHPRTQPVFCFVERVSCLTEHAEEESLAGGALHCNVHGLEAMIRAGYGQIMSSSTHILPMGAGVVSLGVV